MTQLVHTIWAFLLNVFGFPIFRTCFANAMEDEECETLLLGPPFSSVFFSTGVYMIILNSTLFPRSFNEPKMIFLMLYEFLATAFLLEFAMACVWTPIDVLLSTTLPTNIYHTLRQLGMEDATVSFLTNKSLTMVLTYTVAITFFLLTLHVTDSVDYTIFRDFGATPFMSHVQEKLWCRLQQEFPFLNEETKACHCKIRRRRRSKSHLNNSR
ncbi:PREDICTED: uncharacterized protein LOC108570301 [Habropoda laboriosa]|uniref:uncharacterized protein LOC108570301 n=1 Tax=Habropoda laboriosa TaxID=597456 RepID=UPI00083D9B91|nr:PREDICTED: uncharacterized protein LOC108570301 [Habropoda laboriosa]